VLKTKHNLSIQAISDLSQLFRSVGIKIPRSARTICKTDVTPIDDNNFIHIGLEKGLRRRILSPSIIGPSQTVILHVFIDGKRHGKGEENSLWLILGRVANCNELKPFVISCFFGTGKPPSVKEFVQPFIDEYNLLHENGVEIQREKYKIILKCVICDAQARAFCKCIIASNGTFACERCECEGVFLHDFHSMCYPDLNANLRTHEEFVNQSQEKHHKGESPFLEIEHLDMVCDFILDYMHLVCLGVMKRLLLNAWLRGEVPHIFSQTQIKTFNHHLMKCGQQLPDDFNRIGRPIEDVDHWKAMEFRTFLLYTGPVVLKQVFKNNPDKYSHFLLLHIGVRILLSPKSTNDQKKMAREILKTFSQDFGHIYGAHHLVYNTHSLPHIADDSIVHETSLDNISSFVYESYLGVVDKMLKGFTLPLAQLKRRLSEMEHSESVLNQTQFRKTKEKKNFLSSARIKPATRNTKNSYCLTNDNKIVLVSTFTDSEVTGSYLKRIDEEFFEDVVPASSFDIYLIDSKPGRQVTWPMNKFENCVKCVVLEIRRHICVVFPMLH